MADFTSVRGWLELDDRMLPAVREVIGSASVGWVVPEESTGWGRYAFFGADVRTTRLGQTRDQLAALAAIREEDGEFTDFVEGIFYVDDVTGDPPPQVWELKGGRLYERPRSTAV